MGIEEELKTSNFSSEQMKANLNLLFTASWLRNLFTPKLKEFNLSHEQLNVLRILRGQHQKSIPQKDILVRMLDRSSNLTAIISKLKKKGLIKVERSVEDKREYEISIEKEGLALLKEVDKEINKIGKNYTRLSVSEAFHLNQLLNKMREPD